QISQLYKKAQPVSLIDQTLPQIPLSFPKLPHLQPFQLLSVMQYPHKHQETSSSYLAPSHQSG
ncbi:10867_t:CDS:1, partial [Racocetra persica]